MTGCQDAEMSGLFLHERFDPEHFALKTFLLCLCGLSVTIFKSDILFHRLGDNSVYHLLIS